jgi:hypothetical protein
MRRSYRGRALTVGLLTAVVAVAVFLALRPNAELEALKADPLARWQPTAAHTVGGTPEPLVREQEEGIPSVEVAPLPGLGDREGATYTRTFSVRQAAGLEPFEAARRAAEEAGWRLDYPDYVTADSPATKTWTTVTGYKELSTGTAVVRIQTDAARPTPDAPARTNTLVVILEHTR